MGHCWSAVGPAAAVKYSSQIFLIATVAIALQVIFNLEAIRYTLYTGEPILAGIMRLSPGPRVWAGFYTVLGFFQLGWPALAGSAAATLLGAWIGRMPGTGEQAAHAWVATALILGRERAVTQWHWRRIAVWTALAGVAYTVFSEWTNTAILGSWAYSELMPTLKVGGIELGASPLAQWLLLPPLALYLARRAVSEPHPVQAA